MAVLGFADLHNHQFAHLGFGGVEFFGEPLGPVDQALPWCDTAHGLGGAGDVIGEFMKWSTYGFKLNFGHKVGGYPEFDGWPRWDSYTHQTVHVDWLERAWQGGMRLMVMLAVNNEWMCELPGFKLAPGRTPADMEAVDLQLDAAVALEAQLDQQAGRAGQGWYRIVRSAQEAASVIEAGKLAVILGIEVDYLFGSYLNRGLTPDQVKAAVQQYYDKGVRYVFPVHFADNAFGGTGLQNSMQWADSAIDISTPLGDLQTPYVLQTEDGRQLGYEYDGGKKNKRGLTALGQVLLHELIAHGMLFDVDHMSYNTRSAALDIAEAASYPVISGHSGFLDVLSGAKRHEGQQTGAEVDRLRGTGGMVAPIIAQGNLEQVNTWKRPDGTSIPHVCGSTINTYVQAYLYAVERMNGGPVGIGTDFNGFAGVPGPIAGPDACPGNKAPNSPPPAQLSYPFTAAVTGAQMQRSQIGQKTFEINIDGLAHVGMLPDFIAHLTAMGVRDDELQPLLHSADSFVQTWRRTSPGVVSAPGALIADPANGSTPVKFFMAGSDGHLWENAWDIPQQAWIWTDHGVPRSGVSIVSAPGALLIDPAPKFFMAGSDGHLWENYWNQGANAWQWTDHGVPGPGVSIVSAPGALIADPANGSTPVKFFMAGSDGHLWENAWDIPQQAWIWTDHGVPRSGVSIVSAPGALLIDPAPKFFMAGSDGHLWENYWNQGANAWQWTDHGVPGPGVSIVSAPGALIADPANGSTPVKFFMAGSDGHLWENAWDIPQQAWIWTDHGVPRSGVSIVSAPGALLIDPAPKFFMAGSDGHLWENYWNQGANAWQWTDHGVPGPGVSIVSAPGALIADPANGSTPVKFFMAGSDGHLWENAWDIPQQAWIWTNHGIYR